MALRTARAPRVLTVCAAVTFVVAATGCGGCCYTEPTHPGQLALWFGQASGPPVEQQPLTLAYGEEAFVPDISGVATDLNGDQQTDLMINRMNNLCLLAGNGAGAFSIGGCTDPKGGVGALALGDFNGDRHPDLAQVNLSPGAGKVGLWLGKGDGTFVVQGEMLLTYQLAHSPRAADFDGDGKSDLAVIGNWPDAHSTSVGQALYVMLGKGDGTFQAATATPTPSQLSTLTVGDFDEDGRSDVLVWAMSGGSTEVTTLDLRLGRADGSVSPPTSSQAAEPFGTAISVADFDGDHHLDLVLTPGGPNAPGDHIGFLPGHGDGTFGPERAVMISGLGGRAWVGDFNGDQKPDLAVEAQRTEAAVMLLMGQGDGTFVKGALLSRADPKGQRVEGVVLGVGDFNGDAVTDLAMLTPQTGGEQVCPFAFQAPLAALGAGAANAFGSCGAGWKR